MGQVLAERIVELKRAGADLILLGFLHFKEEVGYFGRTVIPLVRELEARVAATAWAAASRWSPSMRPRP